MKKQLRSLLKSMGVKLTHLTNDPIVENLDHCRERIRLAPTGWIDWQHDVSSILQSAHLRALLDHFRPDLVVDVGANHGQFAASVRQLGYLGPMISLEPQADLFEQLKVKAKADAQGWEVFRGGASDHDGEMELNIFKGDTFSSFHQPNATAKRRFESLVELSRVEKVPVKPLSDWLELSPFAQAQRIFLKTDTQGHDLEVIRGAAPLLPQCCMIMSESSSIALYDRVTGAESLGTVLQDHGFKFAAAYPLSFDDKDLTVIESDALFVRPASLP